MEDVNSGEIINDVENEVMEDTSKQENTAADRLKGVKKQKKQKTAAEKQEMEDINQLKDNKCCKILENGRTKAIK